MNLLFSMVQSQRLAIAEKKLTIALIGMVPCSCGLRVRLLSFMPSSKCSAGVAVSAACKRKTIRQVSSIAWHRFVSLKIVRFTSRPNNDNSTRGRTLVGRWMRYWRWYDTADLLRNEEKKKHKLHSSTRTTREIVEGKSHTACHFPH